MLTLKLLLIASTVYLSSLAARYGGHRLSGLITGMPMIIGPIFALLLYDHGPARTGEIALATLVCFPATLVHSIVFAWACRRLPWAACLLLATVAYVLFALALKLLSLPPMAVGALAVLSPTIALRLMPPPPPDGASAGAPVHIPRQELVLRIAAALAMAASIIVGADFLPVFVSGLLLAAPITGAVLPCFTLPRYGAAATVQLLGGFARGLHGLCAFVLLMCLLLPVLPALAAFCLSLLVAGLTGWVMSRRPAFKR